MTAIALLTAYPRLDARLTPGELTARHELTLPRNSNSSDLMPGVRPDGWVILATLLKTRQDLGYFPPPDAVPDPLLAILAGCSSRDPGNGQH